MVYSDRIIIMSFKYHLSMLLVTDLMFVVTNLVVTYCGYDGLTACNFVYCDKSLGNQIVFCK